MIKIFSPKDELQLAMIRGLLDSEDVRYFVLNDNFGSMRLGPQIDLVNKKTIMVAPEDVERAKDIISTLVELDLPEEGEPEHYTMGQKFRMAIEALLFCWFVPGRKRKKLGK